MTLGTLDWAIIGAFFVITLAIGIYSSRSAGKSDQEFFLSGRSMPWWLLGISMVATTFAADTPAWVAQQIREGGVWKNWIWWSLCFGSMLTAFVFAKLWRRSGITTDLEFYELRYSGKSAAFLRGFRSIYVSGLLNVLIMGNVCLAAIKFGEIVLGIPAWQMLTISGAIIIAYSSLGGFKGILLTDLFQFAFAMIGSIAAAVYLLGHERVGGLANVLSHPNVVGDGTADSPNRLDLFPDFSQGHLWITFILIPLALQWWANYYPSAEPGGGGFIVQRTLAARNEKHALGATLLFAVAHYALRPWPWILIGLASLVAFPTTDAIAAAFPDLDPSRTGKDDIAYPAMLTLLPTGLLGLVAASLLAAFFSTMSTQVNLGASYFVNDFYKRFIKPDTSARHYVLIARIATAVMLLMGMGVGLILESPQQAFDLLLLIGAGTGGIFILRWFWWRISAFTEIIAMISALIIASVFTFLIPFEDGNANHEIIKKTVPVALTTLVWVLASIYGPKTERSTLLAFYQKIRPAGPGWKDIRDEVESTTPDLPAPDPLPRNILAAALATLAVYGALIATGLWIYGRTTPATILTIATIGFTIITACLIRDKAAKSC